MTARPSERGVALLTVLLLVAVMSTIAVAVLDDIRFAIRRSSNAQAMGQAQWYAMGAERLAMLQLTRAAAGRSDGVTLPASLNGMPVTFPVDGGVIATRLSDRGACFNLNSVVSGAPEASVRDPAGSAQFRSLLTALEVDDAKAQQIAAALVDWIDSDNSPSELGAEDETYARLSPPYRTANMPLVEETELRSVLGVTPEVYARLRPLVCALPHVAPTMVNVNALKPADAPVLAALYQGRLPLEAARQAIEARPKDGWREHREFLDEPSLAAAVDEGGAPPIQQISLSSRFFELETLVELRGAEFVASGLIEASPSGQIRMAARRWAPAE